LLGLLIGFIITTPVMMTLMLTIDGLRFGISPEYYRLRTLRSLKKIDPKLDDKDLDSV
jgi:hypothetical protein